MSDLQANLHKTMMDIYNHKYGMHGSFKGHRYRSGKNRCALCGAFKQSEDNNPLIMPELFLSGQEG